jgi:hypothetical protein
VCASPDTPIATPDGERPIASLLPGDLVYTAEGGITRAVPILKVNRVRVWQHRVVQVRLHTGRTLEISARHPTADGRTFGDLTAGARLDGVVIDAAKDVAYHHEYTYDILPDSESGTYYAAGVLVGSTLSPGF